MDAGFFEDQGADAELGQLGRSWPAPARQLRGISGRGVGTEMAGGARRRALDAFLHRLRRRVAKEILQLLPEGREERLGQTAESAIERSSSGREVRNPPRRCLAAA